MSRFDGFRVYNGCPDATMQRRLDAEDALWKQVLEKEPEACCTYFPVEEKSCIHVWGRFLTGMHDTAAGAMREYLQC